MAHYFGDSSGFNADDYIVTKPARDWVMGYEDQKLEQLPHVRNHIVWPLQHNMSVSTQTEWAPTPKNQTLQIWTGASRSLGFAGYMSRVQNIGNAQVCPSFVDTSDLNSPWCTDAWPCPDHMDCPDVETRPELRPIQAEGSQLGYINGSTGQRFPWQPGFSSFSSGPLDCRHSLYLWVPCLLRTVALQCDRTEVPFTVQANSAPDGDETGSEVAVTTRRFRIAPEDAMPSTERPFNAGYNMFGSPWIWNLTAQRQAPIFMSLPHFANSTFEFNTTTKQTDSNVHGLRAPDNYSLPWLGIEIYSGVRLRGAMRFQTNVLVTGKSGNWSEPWMVPIGRVSYEHNASDSTISTIYDQSYGILPRVAARAAQVVSLFFATMLLMLSVQIGVKYYQFERGLMKTKNRKLSRSGAASSYVRRTCLRCGLCGPDRSDIIKRLHEMRQEELLTPLLAGGHSPLRQSVQEEEVALSTPSRKRYAATDDQKIEVHFGQLEQMSSDESDEDDAARNENVHVVTQLDLQTWDDLVAPPGRSQLQKCALIWELMPWIYWWAVGIVPKWMLSAVTLEANSLIVAAILSGFVVASQVVQRLCTAKKDRVFVLVPTVLDISTLLIFSASALIADIGENGGNNWDPWPAIIHGSMLVATVLCVAFGHPFMLPVYCRELRPEIWRERIVFRLSEIVSWVWCIILLLVTALQTVPAFTPQMPSSEKGFMIAWIPIMLLVMIFWFTIWFSMQVEEEFVRALNRLLRKGELMSRRDGTPRVDAFPTPVAAQVETQQQPATDSSTQDGMDLHIVPTLSPMSAPNRGKIEIRRPVDLSATTAAGRECDITTNAPLPELVLDASLQVPEPLVAAHKADRSAALAATQFADASEEVLSASLQPEVVHTVGKAELDKAELDKAELEEKNKEIQQSVSGLINLHHVSCCCGQRMSKICPVYVPSDLHSILGTVCGNRSQQRWRNRPASLRNCSTQLALMMWDWKHVNANGGIPHRLIALMNSTMHSTMKMQLQLNPEFFRGFHLVNKFAHVHNNAVQVCRNVVGCIEYWR